MVLKESDTHVSVILFEKYTHVAIWKGIYC